MHFIPHSCFEYAGDASCNKFLYEKGDSITENEFIVLLTLLLASILTFIPNASYDNISYTYFKPILGSSNPLFVVDSYNLMRKRALFESPLEFNFIQDYL